MNRTIYCYTPSQCWWKLYHERIVHPTLSIGLDHILCKHVIGPSTSKNVRTHLTLQKANSHAEPTSELFCVRVRKQSVILKVYFVFFRFSPFIPFRCLQGSFITRSLWWTDHPSRDYDLGAQALWCIALYTYQRHYGLRSTSLWSTVLHFTGQAPHTPPREHLWGEKKNILHSQLHTYVYFYGSFCMFRRPAELDPGIRFSPLFSAGS